MHLPRKSVMLALASIAVVAVLASCGEGATSGSNAPSDQPSNASTQQSSQPSAESSSNAADTVGNLILLKDKSEARTLTFIDTQTGESSSRTFTLPDEAELNPGSLTLGIGSEPHQRLPFNSDFTKLAVVNDKRDSAKDYYLSAGYVEADGQYVEVTTAESSFGGEGGFYAATFQGDQLLVLNKNNEWVDPDSGEVQAPAPEGFDSQYLALYISGSGPTDYGLGRCPVPSRVTSGCYQILRNNGDIEFTNGRTDETIATGGECEETETLLAVDSEDNFLYCVAGLSTGQQQLVRIERSTGEARAITPETDQGILQAVVSSNDKQVLFTAQREDDPIMAYVVPATGGKEPRKLSALTGQLSEQATGVSLGEPAELYRWTAK